jgi:phytoene synthase
VTGTEQARRMLAVGSKSFALAGKILPRGCRDDAAVVYAYCRRADDLVDEATPGTEPQAVALLQRELAAIYAGHPQAHPVLAAFQEVVSRRRIPHQYPAELIEGFAMDARPRPIVYQSWEELRLYCFRVAGTVGLMMCHVMDMTDPRVLPDAASLGMAMQLTNIARDVADDWELGRVYVPAVLLRPPVPGDRSGQVLAFKEALPALLASAEELYRAGDRGLEALSIRCAIAVRAARLVYAAIGEKVAARGCDVTAPRAVISRPRKLWLLARAAVGVLVRRLRSRPRRRHAIAAS